jgi:hypothetical protein
MGTAFIIIIVVIFVIICAMFTPKDGNLAETVSDGFTGCLAGIGWAVVIWIVIITIFLLVKCNGA